MRTTNTAFVELEVIKQKFFNKELTKRIGKEKAKSLGEAGAYTRRAARSSMKKAPANPKSLYGSQGVYKKGKKQGQTFNRKGRYSSPGQPPFYRTSRPNIRTILFGFEEPDSVIIGPIKLPNSRPQSRTAPNVLELGGRVRRKKRRPKKRKRVAVTGARPMVTPEIQSALYKKRPFMYPALKAASADMARKWRGRIS